MSWHIIVFSKSLPALIVGKNHQHFPAVRPVSFHTPSLSPATGSQDSKDGLSASAKGTDDEKPPSMPEETGKSKVASWLTSQGLKKVSTEEIKEE